MPSNRSTRVKKNGRSHRSIRSVTEQLRKRAGGVTDDLRQMGNTVKDATQEKLDELRETAADRYAEGREKALGLGRSMQRYIEEQPLKSVLITAGVALLVGRFWPRR